MTTNATQAAAFCRERELAHRDRAEGRQVAKLPLGVQASDARRYHESKAASWAAEALFWEAVAAGTATV